MLETHLNMFDAVVIGIMALSCLFAFFRGLVREILSLAAWIGAGFIAIYYYPGVSTKLEMHFKSATVAKTISIIGVYIIALVVLSLINMIVIKSFKSGSEAGVLDSILGLMFGAFRGALILSLGFFMVSVWLPERDYPDWLKNSVTRPYVEQGAVILAKVTPQYLRGISNLEHRANEEIKATTANQYDNEEPSADKPADNVTRDDSGYSRDNARQLDRLIDSTNRQ